MLGAWAEQTERVEIGALVTGGGYRNPDLLADMARTVDHISGGRLILGIGGGWFEKDYDEYGYEFGTPGSRLNLLGRVPAADRRPGCERAQPAADPADPGADRRRRRAQDAAARRPVRLHLARVRRPGHPCRTRPPMLAEHCAAIGRDPAEIEHSTAAPGRGHRRPRTSWSTPGFTLFTIGVSGPDYDLSTVPTWVAWRDAGTRTAARCHRTLGQLSPPDNRPSPTAHWVIRWCRHPIVTSQIGIETRCEPHSGAHINAE